MNHRVFHDVTIASGNSLSGAIEDLKGYRLAGIQMPSAFDGTSVTLQGSVHPGDTYQDIHDSDGNELTVTVATGQYVNLGEQDVEEVEGLYGIKLRSGTSGTPQSQSADRDFTVVLVSA